MRLLLAAAPEGARLIPIGSDSERQFTVDAAPTGLECLELAALYDYDALVLDLGIAGPHGYDVLRTLRRQGGCIPILALASTQEAEGRTRALDLGADDCISGPFDRDECLARLKAVVRRSRGHADSVIEVGDLRVNIARKTVEVHGQNVDLTRREYSIMEIMTLRKGYVVPRELIMSHLYGENDWPDLKIVDIFIHKIRTKIARSGVLGTYIHTAWGRGFYVAAAP